MSIVAIQAPDIRDARLREEMMRSLPDVAGELLVPGETVTASALGDDIIAVHVPVDGLSEAKIQRFIERIVDLSRSAEQTFSILVTLDSNARLRHLAKRPGDILGDGHLIWVRPTEGAALNAYFAYLFGHAAP